MAHRPAGHGWAPEVRTDRPGAGRTAADGCAAPAFGRSGVRGFDGFAGGEGLVDDGIEHTDLNQKCSLSMAAEMQGTLLELRDKINT